MSAPFVPARGVGAAQALGPTRRWSSISGSFPLGPPVLFADAATAATSEAQVHTCFTAQVSTR